MIYGYKRPLVGDENGEKQLTSVQIDQLFIESHPYAKKRIALEEMLMSISDGDMIIVQNLMVITDSLHQLLDILRVIDKDKATIYFLEEGIFSSKIVQIGFLQQVQLFASLQSKLLSHSSTFHLLEAKKQGKIIGRPKKSEDNLKKAFAMYESKQYSLIEIKNETGISKSTLYRYIDDLGNK